MDKVHIIPIPKAKIAIKESELMNMLVKDPELMKTCLKRGKGIIRSESTRERVATKVEKGQEQSR